MFTDNDDLLAGLNLTPADADKISTTLAALIGAKVDTETASINLRADADINVGDAMKALLADASLTENERAFGIYILGCIIGSLSEHMALAEHIHHIQNTLKNGGDEPPAN